MTLARRIKIVNSPSVSATIYFHINTKQGTSSPFSSLEAVAQLLNRLEFTRKLHLNSVCLAINPNLIRDPHVLHKLGTLEEWLRSIEGWNGQCDADSFACLLQRCSKTKSLEEGQRIHGYIIQNGLEQDTYLCNNLINMYGKCGCPEEGRKVFDVMYERNLVTWNAMLAAYVQHGDGTKALQLFRQMQEEGETPDTITYIILPNSCFSPAALADGNLIYAHILENNTKHNLAVRCSVINMYGKCGNSDYGRYIFDTTPGKDINLWNSMMEAYAQNTCGKQAFCLLLKMQTEGMKPNMMTFISAMDACERLGEGRIIHLLIISYHLDSDVNVENGLINMYSKLGSLIDAHKIFHRMSILNIASWNSMISACIHHEYNKEAFQTFRQMRKKGFIPNDVTFVAILGACASLRYLGEGKLTHVLTNPEPGTALATALITMYGACRRLEDAQRVFDKMSHRNIISWNAMLALYAQHGCQKDAMSLLYQMNQEGVKVDDPTVISILEACADLVDLINGTLVHSYLLKHSILLDLDMGNALLNMYGKSGCVKSAHLVFDTMVAYDVVSWNAMIAVHSPSNVNRAFQLYQEMQYEGFNADIVTLISTLNECSNHAKGKVIHAHILESAHQSEVVIGNAVLNMYGKCTNLDSLCKVFNEMEQRDAVSWTAMIKNLAQHGHAKDALLLFHQMQVGGFAPTDVTYISALDACGTLSALEEGKLIHMHIVEHRSEITVMVGTALINMYGSAGNLDDANSLFHKIKEKNVILWNTLISAFAHHGQGKKAFQHLQRMLLEGVKANDATLLGILSACSHAGLFSRGWLIFVSMAADYDVSLMVGHYGCMLELLGRATRLDEAEDFIHNIPHAIM